jgi:outer membrane murein-binding lipoprotein Lpp
MEQKETRKAALARLESMRVACEEERKKLFAVRNAELETEEYVALEREKTALGAKRDEVSKRQDAVYLAASEKFVECRCRTERSAWAYYSASYSSNILPETLAAVGKHVKIEALKCSQVETLVNQLIRLERARLGGDALSIEFQKLGTEVSKLNSKQAALRNTVTEKHDPAFDSIKRREREIDREEYAVKHPQQIAERKKVEGYIDSDNTATESLAEKIYKAEFAEGRY